MTEVVILRENALKNASKMYQLSTTLLILFPDLLRTKPKARSGKVRKFVFLDWLLHLTLVQSPL